MCQMLLKNIYPGVKIIHHGQYRNNDIIMYIYTSSRPGIGLGRKTYKLIQDNVQLTRERLKENRGFFLFYLKMFGLFIEHYNNIHRHAHCRLKMYNNNNNNNMCRIINNNIMTGSWYAQLRGGVY